MTMHLNAYRTPLVPKNSEDYQQIQKQNISGSANSDCQMGRIHFQDRVFRIKVYSSSDDPLSLNLNEQEWKDVAHKLALIFIKKNALNDANSFIKAKVNQEGIQLSQKKLFYAHKQTDTQETTEDYLQLVRFIRGLRRPTPAADSDKGTQFDAERPEELRIVNGHAEKIRDPLKHSTYMHEVDQAMEETEELRILNGKAKQIRNPLKFSTFMDDIDDDTTDDATKSDFQIKLEQIQNLLLKPLEKLQLAKQAKGDESDFSDGEDSPDSPIVSRSLLDEFDKSLSIERVAATSPPRSAKTQQAVLASGHALTKDQSEDGRAQVDLYAGIEPPRLLLGGRKGPSSKAALQAKMEQIKRHQTEPAVQAEGIKIEVGQQAALADPMIAKPVEEETIEVAISKYNALRARKEQEAFLKNCRIERCPVTDFDEEGEESQKRRVERVAAKSALRIEQNQQATLEIEKSKPLPDKMGLSALNTEDAHAPLTRTATLQPRYAALQAPETSAPATFIKPKIDWERIKRMEANEPLTLHSQDSVEKISPESDEDKDTEMTIAELLKYKTFLDELMKYEASEATSTLSFIATQRQKLQFFKKIKMYPNADKLLYKFYRPNDAKATEISERYKREFEVWYQAKIDELKFLVKS